MQLCHQTLLHHSRKLSGPKRNVTFQLFVTTALKLKVQVVFSGAGKLLAKPKQMINSKKVADVHPCVLTWPALFICEWFGCRSIPQWPRHTPNTLLPHISPLSRGFSSALPLLLSGHLILRLAEWRGPEGARWSSAGGGPSWEDLPGAGGQKPGEIFANNCVSCVNANSSCRACGPSWRQKMQSWTLQLHSWRNRADNWSRQMHR